MTSEQLSFLQHIMGGVMLLLLGVSALMLVLGLVRPSWVRAASRWRAVGRALLISLLGVALYAGTIIYTHSHPEGPHAVKGYIEDYFTEQCAQGADLPGCKDAPAAQQPPDAGR
jgi:hypothetical protein